MLIFVPLENRNISAPKHEHILDSKDPTLVLTLECLKLIILVQLPRFVNASLFCFNPEHPALILRYMLIFIPLISQLIEVLEHITYLIFYLNAP